MTDASLPSPSAEASSSAPTASSSSDPTPAPPPTSTTEPAQLPPIKNLILDAAPLLTLSPLRGLASKYLIAPQVLAEIRDKRAREHFDRLSLLEGVEVEVRDPDLVSLAMVSKFAKQTGDYAVLSHTDLCVLALTYAVEVEENGLWRVRTELGKPPLGKPPGPATEASGTPASAVSSLPPTDSSPAPSTSQLDTPLAPNAPPPSTSPTTAPPVLPLTSTWGKKHLQTPAALPASSSSPAASHPYPLTDAPGKTAPKDLSWKSATPVPSQTPKVPLSSAEDLANELFHSSLDDNDNTSSPADAPSTSTAPPPPSSSANILLPPPVHEENQHDSDEDSSPEAGEWITPTNISTHKARDLGLSLPDDDEAGGGSKKKKKSKSKPRAIMKSACMTSDFAVQNVLLQMGLNLVGGEGRRIRSVRSWVLRCHACFRLCKDPTKKFCPTCGGPTLMRTSITTVTPTSNPSDPSSSKPAEPTTIVHLKKNFQYHNRGTVFSIPAPKMGSAKAQSSGGSGLVLREDDAAFQRGVRMEEGRRVKAERKLAKGLEEGKGAGTWRDADWMPEMYSVGMSGKGRRGEGLNADGGFLPRVGHGRKNPNAVGRKKK